MVGTRPKTKFCSASFFLIFWKYLTQKNSSDLVGKLNISKTASDQSQIRLSDSNANETWLKLKPGDRKSCDINSPPDR